MNDNVSESDTDFEEEGTNGAGGGIVRSALRNFFRLGDLMEIKDQIWTAHAEQKVRVQTPIKLDSIDKASVRPTFGYFDWMRTFFQTTDKTRILHYFSVVSNAIPGFLKSSVLGSTLFYAYDSFFEATKTNIRIFSEIPDVIFPFSYYKNIYRNQDKNNEDNAKIYSNYNIKDIAGNSLFVVSFSSFLVGGIGGAIHASFYLLWDAISQKFVNVGTVLAHSFVHSALFSFYESSRMIGLHGAMLCDLTESDLTDSDSTESYNADVNTNTNKDKNENGNNDNNDGDGDGDGNIKNDSILGKLLTSQSSDEIIQHATETAVVLIAGGIAGMAAESVQHYVQPLENLTQGDSVSQCLKGIFLKIKIGRKGGPAFRSLLAASIPSSLGFLAYEIGKKLG